MKNLMPTWGPQDARCVSIGERLPFCNFHVNCVARYDFKTSMGPWAYGCRLALLDYRASRMLGTGAGQYLITKGELVPERFALGAPVCNE